MSSRRSHATFPADAVSMDFAVSPARRLVAEALGTALLIAVVIGSGLRAERLAAGNAALALLANSLASGAGLAALLLTFGGISGGHLNPAVTLSAWLQGMLPAREALGYGLVQCVGAVAGVIAVHLMFGEPPLSGSNHARTGAPMWWSEFLATFGLIAVAMGNRARPAGAAAVRGGGLYRRGLLVHRLDLVRQSCADAGVRADGELQRHPCDRCAGLRAGAVRRCADRDAGVPLAAAHRARRQPCRGKVRRCVPRRRRAYQRRLSWMPKIEPVACEAQASAGAAKVMPSTSLARL